MSGLVDIIIVILIALGGVVGFKHGAVREATKFVGFAVVLLISFILKDSLMVFLYENLPFFDFFGFIKGISAINILFYQLVAFLIIFAALMFILKVLVVITGLVEWLLKMTVILSLPSKLLGIVVGVVEYYVYIFMALYVLNMPIFNLNMINDSLLGNKILYDSPILSDVVSDTVYVYADVFEIIKNKENKSNKEINSMVLATMLDHHLITIDSARELVQRNKVVISDESLLDMYNNDENLYNRIKEAYYGN